VRRTRVRRGLNEKIFVVASPSVTVTAYRPPYLHLIGSPGSRRPSQAGGSRFQITPRPVPPSGYPILTRGLPPRLQGKSTGLGHGRSPVVTQGTTHKPADKQQVASISTISTTKSPDLFRAPERGRPLVALGTERTAIARTRKRKAKDRRTGRAKYRSPHKTAASRSRRKQRK
jgi:hypothetical protein